MKITIEPKAREYILAKITDKTITLEVGERPAGGDEHKLSIGEYPSVAKGKSKQIERNPQNYDEVTIDGVRIFFRAKFADAFKSIHVKSQRLLFMTMLIAEGEK